ncbi:VWD domain-containing protein, partial [Alteriqipengyuania lutimaris]|uniref:VWD domain-containing protein n=1 Tax=Alteriqipengyuania lutimaris TaxID=1538146 RepID=UPI0011C04442
GNFSVALDLASKSIIIADHHTSIEFAKDSSFKANGQAAEYPYVDGDFVVWKDYFTINVKHKAGLFVRCDKLHQFCTFHVSGYYFGKTRGLLGALDYEPWDDFKQPNGQVVTNVNDFGNSWKVDPSCADVSGPTHHDHEMPEPQECANIFGGSTSLRLGYFFVPSAPFREACSHIVADESTPEAKKKAACSVAAAYTIAAHKYIHISVPEECVHCSVVDGSPIEVGDSVSVKVPKNSADVIIVVEQDTHNTELFKELVSPLVTTLTNDLKAKDITNVHFTLIGYGEATHNYPALYTTGGKISFEGKTKNMKFIDHIDALSLKLDSCENRWKYLTALIESELGLSAPSRAYQLGSKYPFKIGTSKVLVGLVANTKTSAFGVSLQQLLALFSTKVLRDRGVAFHLIAPVQDLHITSKDAKVTKTVVGFDSDHVYVLSDAKKKVLEGSTELRNNLVYQNNIWIPIALDSYGVTYVAQNFLEAKSSARKQFLQVVSHRIAESLGTELHEDCTCRLVSGLYPFSECKVTNRKEREPLAQIRGTKGVKG